LTIYLINKSNYVDRTQKHWIYIGAQMNDKNT